MTEQRDRTAERAEARTWRRLLRPTRTTIVAAYVLVIAGLLILGTRDDTAARLTDSYEACAAEATGLSTDEIDVIVEAPRGMPLVVVGGFDIIPADVHDRCFDMIVEEARSMRMAP